MAVPRERNPHPWKCKLHLQVLTLHSGSTEIGSHDYLLQTNEPLYKAYYLKEDLDQIWMQPNKEEAEKQLQYWCKRAQESKLPAMMKVANMLLSKRTGILAWYDCKVTNAILEGTNNKVKVLKRKAYGYRDDEYFKLLLLGMKDETGKTEQHLSDQREKRKSKYICLIHLNYS